MFARFVQGPVADPEALGRLWRQWREALAADVDGWIDAAGGITAEGAFVAVMRFASPEAAQPALLALDARRAEAAPCFAREPVILHSDDATAARDGPIRDAGFVQLMLSTVTDPPTVERIERDVADVFAAWRPDELAAHRVWLPDGRRLSVDYFTSEAEARANQQREPPPELVEAYPEWMARHADLEWFELSQPWIAAR